VPPSSEAAGRPLRADAAGNRARIIAAAQRVFGAEGVAAPLTRVAQVAGVGIATLYRRFPDRESLIAAAFDDVLERYARNAEAALDQPDPWEGFTTLVLGVGQLAAENLGFAHLVQAAAPMRRGRPDSVPPSFETVHAVVERARLAGVLREGFSVDDLPVLSFALAGIIETTRDDAPDTWRRHALIYLDGCRPPGVTPLPPPIEPTRLQRAMVRARRRRQGARVAPG
jgi:AcrR family transcriptional regulator